MIQKLRDQNYQRDGSQIRLQNLYLGLIYSLFLVQTYLPMRGKSNKRTYSGGFSYQHSNNSKSQPSKKQNVTFLLVSQDMVGISIGYNLLNNALKDLIKNKYGAIWSKDSKLWEIPLNNYKPCMSEVIRLFESDNKKQNQTNVNKIPEFVFRAQKDMELDFQIKNNGYSVVRMIKYNQLETLIEPRVLPFYYKLYDFQKQSLEFGIKRHGRMLLADEMGVGKTIQSIALVSIYRHQWPFLVICPSSLRLNWQQEIINWLSQFLKKTEIQVYSKGGTPIRENAKALIVSYDLAWKIRDMLESFQVVVADEAHYLKNTGNKRTDTLMPFLSTRKRVILLSGTPALAKPREIYNLLSIVRPDIFTNFKEFGYRYCDPTVNPWSRAPEFNGCQNSKELHYLINNKIMIRRLKKDVLTQLPDKQRQKIYVQTDKTIIKQIKQLLNFHGTDQKSLESIVMQMLYKFDSNEPQRTQDARQAITQAYTLTGRAKLQAVKEYILQLLQNGIKILIFAHHKVVLDGLESALNEKKFKFIRIDGSITKEARHENVLRFQQDSNVTAALLSITAAGVGLTLTAASTVVFAELHWTPGIMVQAQDRAHRIGQKSSVNCHYLIGQNSLDDILYRNLQKKINDVSSFVDGKSQQLQIEKLSKGEKGKVFIKNKQQAQLPNRSSGGILFKFQSIKTTVDKYFIGQNSQDTDISIVGTDPNYESDIDGSEKSTKRRKKIIQIQDEVQPIMEIESLKKQYETQVQNKEETKEQTKQSNQQSWKELQHRDSEEIGRFIKANAGELLSFSQEDDEESQDQTQSLA